MENKAVLPLWFEWKLAGMAAYAKRDEAVSISRTADVDAEKSTGAILWYGPAKTRRDTVLIQMPHEKDQATLSRPVVMLAQALDVEPVAIHDVLATPEALQDFLRRAGTNSLVLTASGAIGVPITPEAVDALAAASPDDSSIADRFVTVRAALWQTISLDGDQMRAQLALQLRMDELDFKLVREQAAGIPVTVSPSDSEFLFPRLPGLDNELELAAPVTTFQQAEPEPISPGGALIPQTLVLSFTGGAAQMELTLGVARAR